MKHTVKLFGPAREAVGAAEVEISGAATVADVLAALAQGHPVLRELLEVSAVAVNCEYAAPDRALGPGDEIALIPPVSGG